MCRKYCTSPRLMLIRLTVPCAGPVWLQQYRYLTWCCTHAECPKYTPRGSFARALPCQGQEVKNWVDGCPLSITPFWESPSSALYWLSCHRQQVPVPYVQSQDPRGELTSTERENQGCKLLAALALAQGLPETGIYCMDTKSLHVHGSWHALQQASPAPVLVA